MEVSRATVIFIKHGSTTSYNLLQMTYPNVGAANAFTIRVMLVGNCGVEVAATSTGVARSIGLHRLSFEVIFLLKVALMNLFQFLSTSDTGGATFTRAFSQNTAGLWA